LGLAIVKKIIEEHKGSIKIENVLSDEANGSGAIITISIPLLLN
jgi:nitrogen fixation/metabolism regulation signal transduction histidine kinase